MLEKIYQILSKFLAFPLTCMHGCVHTAVHALSTLRLPAIPGIQYSCPRCGPHPAIKGLHPHLLTDAAFGTRAPHSPPPIHLPLLNCQPIGWEGLVTTSLSHATPGVGGGAAAASGSFSEIQNPRPHPRPATVTQLPQEFRFSGPTPVPLNQKL